MPKNLSKLTPAELTVHRAQMAQWKRDSRVRKRKLGLCPNCGVNPSKVDGVTCRECDEKTSRYERAQRDELGYWPVRPGVQIRRIIRDLRRAGKKENAIKLDPYLVERGVGRTRIRAIIRELGL